LLLSSRSVCSLHCYAHHPHLPSFPTRRSSDLKNFEAKTRALVAQYDTFEPVKGYHVNGALTLGENIADNSGLAIAYKAYHLSLRSEEHTSELQSLAYLVCRLLLEKKKKINIRK